MAKKVEEDAREGANTIDPARVEKLIQQMEGINEEFLTHRMSYVASCAPFRKRIADKLQEASDFGIPKKVFKAKIKERALQREIEGIAEDFEEDDREMFEQVTQALGGYVDTPLGKATVDAAARKSEGKRKAPTASTEKTEAGEDSLSFRSGYDARIRGAGASIPNDLKGDDRDRWHNGWLKADRELSTGKKNADALKGGISPLN